MNPGRPRLLLVDDDIARRLELTGWLAARWDVRPATLDDDPVRLARQLRPEGALLAMDRKVSDRVLRVCRTLRTDVRAVPFVGLYEGGSRRRGAWIAMELWMASGYLGLPSDEPGVTGWVEAMARGERPSVVPARAEGALDRLRGMLRGR